jgi:O-antigen/teichoic acid export membrane protein
MRRDATEGAEGALAGTAFAMLAQLTTAASTAAITLYLVRALGATRYGELTLVLSVGGIAVALADAALAQSTARYLAPRASDRGWAATVLAAGLRLKLGVGAVISLVLLALAGPIASAYGDPGMAWPLRAVVVSVFGESLMMLWTTAFQALRRIALSVRLLFLESAAEAAATIGLVALGGGVTGAVVGRGVGYVVGAAAGAVLATRQLRRRLRVGSVERRVRREISGYARPLLLNTSAYTLYDQVNVQLVGALLTRAAVGIYAAPFKIITLLCYPSQSVANAVSPRMSGDHPDVGTFTTSLRWLLVYQTALIAPVVVWAEPLTRLMLGDQFEQSAVALAALAPYLFLRGVSTLASTTVNYLGHARRRIPIVLLSLAVIVTLDVILLPTLGILGAVVGLNVSYAVYVPLHLRICHESFALPLRGLTLTLVRCLAASGAMAAMLGAFGTHRLDAADWLVGGAAGTACYLGVLVITREVRACDVEDFRAVARRAGARLRLRRV